MLAEFVDKLLGLQNTRVLNKFSDTRKVCFVSPAGKPEWVDRPPSPRDHKFSTLASLIKYEAETMWVAPHQVVAILDDKCQERATLPLLLSPIFATLESIASKRLEQKGLIDCLRIQFAGAGVNPETFELAIRKVKFLTEDEQAGDLTPNKSDAMGRSIRAQVQAADELPDAIDFTFRAYPSMDILQTVKVSCAVNVNLKERYFQLIPLPGEIDRAKADAVESVRATLADRLPDVGVFCGTP